MAFFLVWGKKAAVGLVYWLKLPGGSGMVPLPPHRVQVRQRFKL